MKAYCKLPNRPMWVEEFKRIFSLQENIPQVQIDMQAIVNYLHRTVWSMEYQFVARNQVFRCGPVRNLARFNAALDSMALAGRIWIGIDQKTKRRYINLNQQFFQAMSHEMAT